MRIAFFGGTFDPPHNGHLTIARESADRLQLDRVLIAPVAAQPLRPQGAVASFEDRLHMVELLAKADPRFEASRLDEPRSAGKPNYTIDTLRLLRAALHPQDELFVILGIDAFADLPRWREPNALLNLADWIIVSRSSRAAQPVIDALVPANRRSHIHLLDHVHEPASSTEIRARLQRGESCTTLVPEPILSFIEAHQLYR